MPLPKNMGISAHIGTQYQYLPMGNERSGQYTVTLPGGTIIGKDDPMTITSKYRANAQNASPWAMNAGIAFSYSFFCYRTFYDAFRIWFFKQIYYYGCCAG